MELPTAGEARESLGLPEREWETLVCEDRPREVTGPDGQRATVPDAVVKLGRRSG
ncbi:hypothetical protein [Streptomyces carminius]|uniref:hypothetical protein n=1 Tax=Streptomyces carminius TaxID=2665496 RepID=UPI0038CDB048